MIGASVPGDPASCRAPGGVRRVADDMRAHDTRAHDMRADDMGAETIEFVLIIPALMALIVAGLQLALWGLAAHALSLAVAEAGAEARSQSGNPASAIAIVHQDIGKVAGSLVGSLDVQVRSLPDDFLAVSASGVVPTIFPGIHLQVSSVSTGPVQGFRASG